MNARQAIIRLNHLNEITEGDIDVRKTQIARLQAMIDKRKKIIRKLEAVPFGGELPKKEIEKRFNTSLRAQAKTEEKEDAN